MTEKANTCTEILRKAARFGVMDCQLCPAYSVCPTGTAGWNNECMLETAADLIESLMGELERTENNLSELLYYVTGGRYSRSDYSTDDMRRFVDDYNQCTCSECDELEQVKRERDACLNGLRGVCATCKHADYCLINPLPHCNNWQWRGVKE